MTLGKPFFDRHYYLCDLVTTVCLSACVAALYSIGGMSVNMYVQICHPAMFDQVFTVTRTLVICFIIWLSGFGICLGPLVGWSMNIYDEKVLECFWSRTHTFSFTLFFTTVIVFLPLFIISYSFLRIFLHVRASKKRLLKEAGIDRKVGSERSSGGTIARLATTLSIIFAVFIVCWLPYSLLIVIDFDDSLPMEVYLYALLLAHMHSTLNSFVYYFTNPHFKHGYQLVLQLVSLGYYQPNQVHNIAMASKSKAHVGGDQELSAHHKSYNTLDVPAKSKSNTGAV